MKQSDSRAKFISIIVDIYNSLGMVNPPFADLAKALGISTGKMIKWIKNSPDLDRALAAAAYKASIIEKEEEHTFWWWT